MSTFQCTANCTDKNTVENTSTFFFGDEEWWNPLSNLHIDYQEDRIKLDGVLGAVSDINNAVDQGNLSPNGLRIPASSTTPVTFSELDWLNANDYTILIKVRSIATSSGRRILGFSGSGRGIITNGPTNVHFHSGLSITAGPGTSRVDDAGGVWIGISGDQHGRSLSFGDRDLVNTSDVSISMGALYVGERNTGGNEFNGHILEFFHIPNRVLDNDLRLLTNPSHDRLTTGDFILDSALGAVDGNKYDTITNLVAANRLVNDAVIGFQAGSKYQSVSLDLSSYTNAAIIKHGSGADPELYGRGIVTNWAAATEANVYQTTVDTSTWGEPGNAQFITVFESLTAASDVALDDVPFSLQTSEANCSANPSSFYVDYSDANLATVYMHTTNSDDPTTNGHAYSVSNSTNRRMLQDAQQIVGNITIDNVVTDDGISSNTGGLIKDITVQNGHTHGLFCHENATIENVTVKNTLNKGQNISPIVANGNSQGGTFLFKDCTVEQEDSYDQANSGGYYAHKSGALRFESGGTEGCASIGCGSDGGNVGFNETTHGRCWDHVFRKCHRGIVGYPGNDQLDFLRFWAEGKNVTRQKIQKLFHSSGVLTTSQVFNILGGAALSYGNSGGLIHITQPGTYNIQYNTFVGDRAGGDPLGIRIQNSEAIVNIEHNIFSGQRWNIFVDGDFRDNITFRNNVVHDYTSGFAYNGDTTMALSEFEAAMGITSSTNIQADPSFSTSPSTWTQLSDATATANEAISRSAGAEYYTG